MELIRYRNGAGGSPPLVGLALGGDVVPLEGVDSLASLLGMRLADLRSLLEQRSATGHRQDRGDVQLLAPVDGRTEVWACGVTYEESRLARIEESISAASVYDRVYAAARPELFFKSVGWRVAGDGDVIAIREDSTLDVPEPELALVCNRFGEVVGLTACNDVSSRSIEGENPLYLPQAKVYLGSCAVGPVIRPIWEVADPYDLSIGLVIERRGGVAWRGEASTARLHRRFEELVEHLFRADVHPDGVVLSTGTCVVPEAPFGLRQGDVVRVVVGGVGTLTNPVVRGLEAVRAAASPELAQAIGG